MFLKSNKVYRVVSAPQENELGLYYEKVSTDAMGERLVQVKKYPALY